MVLLMHMSVNRVQSLLKCLHTVFLRHREDDHVGEVRRAAAKPPFPVCGLQQVSGQRGSAPFPQKCGLQDCPLVGLQRYWQEVNWYSHDYDNLDSVFQT